MTERTIQFIPKMQAQKKEAILAVAWITARQGGYETPNVARSICHDLRTEGYALTQDRVTSAMLWLVEQSYAVRSVLGRRHRMFMMDPEVAVPEPGFVTARRMMTAGSVPEPAGHPPVTVPVSTNGVSATRPRPPLPGQPADTVPRPVANLTAAVTAWWRSDPEAAGQWVAAVLQELGW